MIIALDYDDTYTKDPNFWLYFIFSSKLHNHETVIVTARLDKDMEEIYKEFASREIKIYNTNLSSKQDYLASLGIKVDVWVDDNPEAIITKEYGYWQ
jgi:hypothetical protein